MIIKDRRAEEGKNSQKRDHFGKKNCLEILRPLIPVKSSYLPDTDNGIGDENEEDDEGLDKRSDGFICIFEEGEYLKKKKNQ